MRMACSRHVLGLPCHSPGPREQIDAPREFNFESGFQMIDRQLQGGGARGIALASF